LGEEGGGGPAPSLWVIDPIDGTANFARGMPHFCVSIAYLRDGKANSAPSISRSPMSCLPPAAAPAPAATAARCR